MALWGGDDEAGYWVMARDHFGGEIPIKVQRNALAAIRAVIEGAVAVAVLPVPEQGEDDPWWKLLASDKAKELATARGIADPQQAEECLTCHVTAYGADSTHFATPRAGKEGFVVAHGVQCEACHGPGSDYKSRKAMKDQEASIAAGLVIPDEALCLTCHNDKSPTFTGFDYEEYLAKVSHPNPKAAAAAE